MSNTRSCGEALVRLLEAYGVELVFGIPGVHTLELYRGLVDSPIRHVPARHEQGAGFMADGYARAGGGPGVCFLITGPGLTNAATAVAQAYSDSVPMLVISSVNATETLGKGWGELHELPDQSSMSAAFTARSTTLRDPSDLPDLLADAFDRFESGRPRPVHIEVPIDVLPMPAADDWRPRARRAKPAPEPDAIDRAALLLARARRPLLCLGGGARGAAVPLREIAEKLAAPVVTTVAGMGVFPGSHPLSLGPTLPSEWTRALIRDSDAVLAVGTELSANETWGPRLELGGDLIRVDIDPAKLADLHEPAVAIGADAAAAASAIASAIAARLPEASGEAGREAARAAVRRAVGAFHAALSPPERHRKDLMELVLSALPDDTIFVGDMTQLAYTACCTLVLDAPRRFLFPKGYGALGYALPAAIGAKLAAPERAVVALVGDSGLLYSLQEMATAVDEDAPIIVLLWNNDRLGAIHDGFLEKGIRPLATTLRNPDYLALARAFGWEARSAPDARSLREALGTALRQGSPTLIELPAAKYGETPARPRAPAPRPDPAP